MRTKWLGRGFGVAVTVAAAVGIPAMSAFADSTCYTGCTPPTTQASGGGGGSQGGGGTRPPVTGSSGSHSGSGANSGSGSGANSGAHAISTKSSGGSLPFTGADVEGMTGIGVGALVVGGVLVRRGRNRRRAEA